MNADQRKAQSKKDWIKIIVAGFVAITAYSLFVVAVL